MRSNSLPLNTLLAPVAAATAVLARLDERLARSPVRDGFCERQHFADAAAALWLEGELVHLEDLTLHDARMDVRRPTHELTRAHAVLRARRLILSQKPDWALSHDGLLALTKRGGFWPTAQPVAEASQQGQGASAAIGASSAFGAGAAAIAPAVSEEIEAVADTLEEAEEPDPLEEEFAAIDAVLARSTKVLEGDGMPPSGKPAAESLRAPQNGLVYDLDWNEEERLGEWRGVLDQTGDLPAVLRSAILLEAWHDIEVLQHAAWLGPLLVAALLRQGGFGPHLLACLHLGAKNIPRERRRARSRDERLLAHIDIVAETALAGLKEHDRLVLAKGQMERKLKQRRASSKLPELIELVLARPIVSTALIQERLKVSKQGALNLVAELGLREMTGRGRFRAWGIV